MQKLLLTDTHSEAEAVLIGVYRRMSPADKWRRLDEMYRRGRLLHATGYRLRHPDATDQDIVDDWLILTVGKEVAQTVKEARRGQEC
jgi:hypothetical protein